MQSIKCAEVVKVRMRAFFWHNRSAADLEPSPCAHRSKSRENRKIEKSETKPTKTAAPRLTCRFEVMRQGRNSQGKIKVKCLPNCQRSDKFVLLRIHVLRSTSSAQPEVSVQSSKRL